MKARNLIWTVAVLTFFFSQGLGTAATDSGPKGLAETTLYVAYTCNTWGQMQPCPS